MQRQQQTFVKLSAIIIIIIIFKAFSFFKNC